MTLTGKIDTNKIDSTRLFAGRNGAKYLDIVILLKDEPDQYGQNGMIVQSVSKEERDKGVRGPILGNVKILGQGQGSRRPEPEQRRRTAPPPTTPPLSQKERDDVPF